MAVRNIRRDANEHVKAAEKDGEITEDDARRMEKDIQKLTDDSTANLEKLAKAKEKEILKD